jgi:leader peptidase (prepilin peptidase)/N-methyltransferase
VVWIELLLAAWFGAVGAWLARVDIAEHRLPDIGTGSLALGVGILTLCAGDSSRLQASLLLAFATAGVLALGAWVPPHPIGWGDVKLQVGLGLYLGWYHPAIAVGGFVLSFILGGVAASWLLFRRRCVAHAPIAFGPFMLAASAWVVWAGKSAEII